MNGYYPKSSPALFISPRVIRFAVALCLTLQCSALTIQAQTWNVTGDGDWYSPASWNPAAVPLFGDSPEVNNGGHAMATSATASGPIDVFLVDVGTNGGTGELTVDQVDMTLQSSLDVGDVAGTVAAGSGTSIVSDGTATISNATSLSFGVGGIGDINVGQTSASLGAIGRGTGSALFDNVTNMQVGGDIDVAQSSGSGQAIANGTATFTDITGTISVAADLDVGQTSAEIGGVNSGTGDVTIERVGILDIGGDIDVAQTTGSGQGSGAAIANIDRVGSMSVGGNIDIGKIRAATGANHTAMASVTISNSELMVGFGGINLGSIEISRVLSSENSEGISVGTLILDQSDVLVANDVIVGELTLGSTSSTNSANATLQLIDSRMDTRDLSIAARFDATAGTVNGTIELTRSLVIVQSLMSLNANSTVTMKIDGTTRALGDGLATDYGAIDADMAALGGTLNIDTSASYAGPTNRGDIDSFELINTLFGITGSFDGVNYNGTAVGSGSSYVGSTIAGDDGLFVEVSQTASQVLLTTYLALPGDANGDGVTDGADFLIWNTFKFTSGNDWTTGDFNGDGVTDGSDFLIWNTFKFTSVDALAAVPEPSFGWCGLIVFGLALRSRFRQAVSRS